MVLKLGQVGEWVTSFSYLPNCGQFFTFTYEVGFWARKYGVRVICVLFFPKKEVIHK